jgi:NifB/MoaA-like Fe-S oxidoreductase
MNQLPDSISITLHFTDLQDRDDTLTNEQARQILQLIQRKAAVFDSEMLDSFIEFYKRNA